jgi:hypothetical protein
MMVKVMPAAASRSREKGREQFIMKIFAMFVFIMLN